MTYQQQQRFAEYTEYGYGKFLNSLDTSVKDAIIKELDDSDLKDEAKFIQGKGDLTKVKIEKVQETLTDAIGAAEGVSNKEELKAAAIAWFKE